MDYTKEDSLRAKGIAVLMLIFHHLFFSPARFVSNGVEPWLLSENALITVATAARVCVWIFVFISAYGITVQYMKRPVGESLGTFTFKRWFSLMKNYWLIYVIVFLVLLL